MLVVTNLRTRFEWQHPASLHCNSLIRKPLMSFSSIFAICTGSMRVACPFSSRYALDITVLLGVQQFTERLGLTDEALTALIYFYQVAIAQSLCDL